MLACEQGHFEVAKFLVDRRANMDMQNKVNKETSLKYINKQIFISSFPYFTVNS